jgi:PLP dependent protein
MALSPFAEPLARIRQQINQALARAGRNKEAVRLIGVSKGKPAEYIAEALTAGVNEIGENYVQELEAKKTRLRQVLGTEADQITWHFIGHLQSNKVKQVVGQVDWIHTVDSLKLATKISQAAGAAGLTQRILLEVNLAKEAAKPGFLPEQLSQILAPLCALPHLSVRGLMAIPPVEANLQNTRRHFRRLKSLLDECNQTGVLTKPFTELSMGMSQDFTIAIEEGATMVRIGTALFGPRA